MSALLDFHLGYRHCESWSLLRFDLECIFHAGPVYVARSAVFTLPYGAWCLLHIVFLVNMPWWSRWYANRPYWNFWGLSFSIIGCLFFVTSFPRSSANRIYDDRTCSSSVILASLWLTCYFRCSDSFPVRFSADALPKLSWLWGLRHFRRATRNDQPIKGLSRWHPLSMLKLYFVALLWL